MIGGEGSQQADETWSTTTRKRSLIVYFFVLILSSSLHSLVVFPCHLLHAFFLLRPDAASPAVVAIRPCRDWEYGGGCGRCRHMERSNSETELQRLPARLLEVGLLQVVTRALRGRREGGRFSGGAAPGVGKGGTTHVADSEPESYDDEEQMEDDGAGEERREDNRPWILEGEAC